MNSADFEAYGSTEASRSFGSSELPDAPKTGDAVGVGDAPSMTVPPPTAETTPVNTTFDHADSAGAVDSSVSVIGEKRKTKRRWPTRALAAAGVVGIAVGGTTMADINAPTNDSSYGNNSWNSGIGKVGNGKPQPPSGSTPQPSDGGGGPQPPSDEQGGSQQDSGNQGSSGKELSKQGENATKNKQNQQQKGSGGQQDSSQTQGTGGQSLGGTDSFGGTDSSGGQTSTG